MTKAQVFFFLLVSFVAGVALRSFLPVPHTILWVVFLGACVLLGLGVVQKVSRSVLIAIFILAALGGVIRFDWFENSFSDLSPLYGKTVEMGGYIIREPVQSERALSFPFRVTALQGKAITRPFDIRVTTRRFPEYEIGDVLRVYGKIEKPEKLGDFDYPTYLKKDGIFAVVAFPKIESSGESAGNPIRLFLASIKRSFESNIERLLPEPHGAFLKGLLVGERESLPEELREAFQITGVTHLVALSGYNITIVGMFFMSFLMLLTVRFYTAFWISVSGIILFVILTGASPSVMRAGIMGVLLLIAQREGRIYRIKNALAFAAGAMIFVNPYVFRFDAAFELSFLATIGLVLFTPRIESALERFQERIRMRLSNSPLAERGRSLPLLSTLAQTLGAQIAVLPLIIFLFGRISLISPLTNILVLIAVPYTMAFGFIAGILGFVSDTLAWIPAFGAWVLLEYMIRVIEFFSRVPFASVSTYSFIPVIGSAILVFVFAYVTIRNGLRTHSV